MHNDIRGDKALQAAVEELMQYFDTVQVFVSKSRSDDETVGQTVGKGNLFARIGQVNIWLNQLEATLDNNNETNPENNDEDATGSPN